jgi:hypothetical protein
MGKKVGCGVEGREGGEERGIVVNPPKITPFPKERVMKAIVLLSIPATPPQRAPTLLASLGPG